MKSRFANSSPYTSGYEDHYYALDYVAPYMARPTTPQEIMDIWGKKPLNFDPGTQWQYSNIELCHRRRHHRKDNRCEPLFDFVRARIFQKLGMQSPIDVDHQPWSAAGRNGLPHVSRLVLRASLNRRAPTGSSLPASWP